MFGIRAKLGKYRRMWFSKLYAIKHEFIAINPIFDTREIDRKIGKHAMSIVKHPLPKGVLKKNHIALLATEIYDSGGHTEVLKNIVQALPNEYKCKLFLTKKNASEQYAITKIAEIKKYSDIDGVDFDWKNEKQLLNKLLEQIIEFSPEKLITFIHMDDTFSVALLALLRKYTTIEIVFCDIGTHHSNLGMSFAHLIEEGTPSTAFITQKYRGFKNTKVVGLCYLTKDHLPIFSGQEITIAKRELGIPENAICTMTGCAPYKIFENEKSSYLEMIKNLLERNENLYHVLITKLSEEHSNVLETMNMPNRLIVTDFKPNFKLYFKCADVFIDSVPLSSALTMVDLMSLKVPFVAFKNRDNLAFTFYEYLPSDYEYLFEDVSSMQTGIEKLLYDKKERERIANSNYEHFLENFEGGRAVRKILETNSFDPEIDGANYKDFKDVKLYPWGK